MVKYIPLPPNFMSDIRDFHTKFGLAYDGKPRLLNPEHGTLKALHMVEELEEYQDTKTMAHKLLQERLSDDAEMTVHLENMLDALVDLVYVALGTAYLHGFDFNEAWRRVHAANMRKVRAARSEDSKRGSAYDIVKPAGWESPSHTDLVEDHAHRKVQ